jgi:hypothetical protein
MTQNIDVPLSDLPSSTTNYYIVTIAIANAVEPSKPERVN